MMHVKRWVLLSLGCLGAEFVLPAVAAAGPTGGHVSASPVSPRTGLDRELFAGPASHGETPRVGDNLRVETSPVRALEAPSPSTLIARPYVIAPHFLSLFWYGRSSLGEFTGAQCANGVTDSTFIGNVAAPNPLLPTDCFRGAFSNGEYDSRTHLVPGQNKDALYGRAYNPDSNSFQ